MKKSTVIILLIAIALLGCDFRVVRDYKELVYHVSTEPPTLNPVIHTDAVAGTIDGFIFDYLIEMDNSTLEYKPKLAKKWEISEDHLEYIFYLRDDVYWHDGKQMTADDVIYSYEKIQDPKVDAVSLRVYYRDVAKVEKVDDFTIRFKYAYPYYRAFEIVGSIPIVPKHILDDGTDFNKHPFGRNPIGSGPYKFEEWRTGSRVVLVRNENYWDKKPEIEGIIFKIVTNMSVALQVLKKGEIDMAGITTIQWEKQTGSRNFDYRFNKHKFYLPNYYYIAWNQERPYFKDARVRRAMTMMLNREKIKEKLYYNLAEIVTGSFYKWGADYNNKIEPYPYDPKEAARLLDDAGWIDHDGDGIRDKDGVPFMFTFMIAGSKSSERLTNILREELQRVGVDMEVTRFEWTVFSKNLQDHAFDATLLGWAMPLNDDPYQVWHSSQVEGGSNFISFKNAEADKIIEDARREFDPQKRHEMYQRFHEILHEEQPYTFLYMTPSLVAIQKRFENVTVYKLGVDIREWRVTRPEMILYQ